MSRAVFPAVLFVMLLAEAAGCGASLAAAIQDPDMVVLPDPDLSKAVRLPAGAATAGTAHISPSLDQAAVRGCSALNPCALAEPGRSDAAMAAPSQPRQGERRRIRQPG